MLVKKVWAVYFSPTGTTKKVVEHIAGIIGKESDAAVGVIDFTLPGAREDKLVFGPGDLAVIGVPVYAGRIPNVLLPFLKEKIRGVDTSAIPVVLFGNRAYDDALKELDGILTENGFHMLAAGAFIGEHSFSRQLAAGRPDMKDMLAAGKLAAMALERIAGRALMTDRQAYLREEEPLRPYYIPVKPDGTTISILKVKPGTRDNCISCGTCARVCPMGSINHIDMSRIEGICIKCGACIKKCPVGAKYFDDEGFLYHMHELEANCTRRLEPEIF